VNKLNDEVKSELTDHILPFWMKLEDKENGGIYGTVNHELAVTKEASKGGIITSRFLWTYSAAARILKNDDYLKFADRLFRFLGNNLIDKEQQGIYWMVDYKGNPVDTRKHVYAQSFAIYALSEYYRASGNENALQMAKELFYLVETKGFDPVTNAYKEEFDREWNEIPNEMLSENGVMADITMNTTIHVLEAYTTLFKAWPSDDVKRSLENLLHILYEKIYDRETKYLGVFFDKNWKSLLNLKSFGHDIEASWLIDEALKALGNENSEYIQMVKDIAYNIASYAIQKDGSLINEEENGHQDLTRVWWVQAEAMVGFLNAYERTKDKKFLGLVENLWSYTKTNIIDSRENGEWHWSVDPDGKPSKKNIGDPWKGSYHNGRFCLEIIERMIEK
jgi:cellobiose epimerase